MFFFVEVHVEGDSDGLVEVDFASCHVDCVGGDAFVAWVEVKVLLFQVAMRGLEMLGALSRKSPMLA